MATEDSRGAPESPGAGDGLLERPSGGLPAMSVALVALAVVGTLASLLRVPGGVPRTPLKAELPAQPSEPASPTPIATLAAAVIMPDLSQGAARLTVEPSDSMRFGSPDGGVSIAVEAESVEETVSLTFSRLSDFQVPALPRGYSGTRTAFDLSAYSSERFSLSEYSLLQPIAIAVQLPASLLGPWDAMQRATK